MIIIAILFDGIQFLLTLTGVGIILAIPIGWFAEISFTLWYFLIGAISITGKSSGLKTFSILGSAVIESVGLVDDLPGITAGVVGVIVSTRIEDKSRKPAAQTNKGRATPVAANDNGLENEYREAA